MQKGWRVSVFSFSSAIATERSQSVSVTHRAYANLDDIPKQLVGHQNVVLLNTKTSR